MDVFGVLSEKIDVISICVGVIGTLLNGVLFLVLSKNHSVDPKCMIIYKNLAAIDAFNCLIIPACFVNLKGHQYNLNLEEPKNSILYLFFGASINIPYLLMILLSVARVMIFRHRLFYTQRFSGNLASGLSLICWSGSICVSVGIWIVYLLVNQKSQQDVDVLIGLMKYNSSVNIILTLVAVFLLFSTIMLLESISHDIRANKKAEEITDINAVHNVHNELKTAKVMFSLFLVSISVWSTYPIMFSTAFAFCGPYFNLTSTFCRPLQSKVALIW